MFERFTERARMVPVFAQDEARALQHNYIGTEHLLLGLARERESVAARIMLEFDVDEEKIRNEVIRQLAGPGRRLQASQRLRRPLWRDIARLRRQIERLESESTHDPHARVFRKLAGARDAALDAGDWDLARKLLEFEIEARRRQRSEPAEAPCDEPPAAASQ